MTLSPESKRDLAIAAGGILATTFFVSSNGNGQNPFTVLLGMLIVSAIVSAISILLSRLVPTLTLAIVASIVISELVFLLYFMYSVASRGHSDPHLAEAFLLLPIVFAIVTSPLIALTAYGIGRIANRYFYSHDTTSDLSDQKTPAM